jgi:hypothetical protein
VARPLPHLDGALLQAALRALQIRRRLSFNEEGQNGRPPKQDGRHRFILYCSERRAALRLFRHQF